MPGGACGGGRAVGADPPSLSEAGGCLLPLLVGPAAQRLDLLPRPARPRPRPCALAGRGQLDRCPQDKSLAAVKAGRHQGRYVTVTAVLAQHGGRMPEPGQRLTGNRQPGIRPAERAPGTVQVLRHAGQQVSSRGHLRRHRRLVSRKAEQPPQRGHGAG